MQISVIYLTILKAEINTFYERSRLEEEFSLKFNWR